jgi:hypothetical protein
MLGKLSKKCVSESGRRLPTERGNFSSQIWTGSEITQPIHTRRGMFWSNPFPVDGEDYSKFTKEVRMETNNQEISALARTQEKTSNSLGLLVRQWLVKLAELFGYTFSSSTVYDLWTEELSDLTPQQVDAGFKRLRREWKPEFGRLFPVPADLRAHIDRAKELSLHEESERAWRTVLDFFQNHFHPDLGYYTGARLDERAMRAAGAAGGIPYLWGCPTDDLVWAKKRFIEAYERLEELEEFKLLLPPEPQKKLLHVAERKTLPGPSQPLPAETVEAAKPQIVRPVAVPLTDDQFHERMRSLQEMRDKVFANASPEELKRAEELRERARKQAQEIESGKSA